MKPASRSGPSRAVPRCRALALAVDAGAGLPTELHRLAPTSPPPRLPLSAFKVFHRKVLAGSGDTLDQTATNYVFDPAGRPRLAVQHEQDAASVAADINRLLKENP